MMLLEIGPNLSNTLNTLGVAVMVVVFLWIMGSLL